jgi:plasmid stabilization system protein ParE
VIADYAIIVLPIAERQIARAMAWWREHRSAAPEAVTDELAATLAKIAAAPYTGAPYGARPGVRRWLLPTVRYHVYYRVDEAKHTVYVRAFWHAMRGQGPRL